MTLSLADPQDVQHDIRDMPIPIQRQMATLILAGYTFRCTKRDDFSLSHHWWNAFDPQGKFMVAHGSTQLSYVVNRVWVTYLSEGASGLSA